MNTAKPADPGEGEGEGEAAPILVVDDLAHKHVVMRAILDELGEPVVSVRSGREALAQLLRRSFAVILLDVNMPDVDGLETAQLIREHPRTAHTPIVFISAHVDDLQMMRGYALGAVDYMPSPVVPQVLRSKVKVFVDLHHMQAQLQRHAREREALARAQAERDAAQAARRRAEEADRRKNEFLAMLAHELRNPLAPIRNAVHILRRADLPAQTLAWARDVIHRQAEHMTRLIDDLLDVSRIVQGKVTVRPEPLALADVVARCIEACNPRLQARQQALQVSLPPQPVPLLGDPVRLAQVLANLVNNASKFSPVGAAIDLEARLAPPQVVLSVRDRGCGIAADVLPHIWDLFVQGEQPLDRSLGGLGVGLTLVRHLVQLHGGQVQAFSDGEGRGCEVVVQLPLAGMGVGCDPDPTAQGPSAPDRPPAPATATGRRILVVDDLQASAESLSLLLQMEGHDVRVAGEGRAALALAEAFVPEVVLLDIGLPGMSGFEVAQQLRRLPSMRQALLVALTGYGEAGSRERSAQAGFDLHLVKPADVGQLLFLLSDPSRARDGAETPPSAATIEGSRRGG